MSRLPPPSCVRFWPRGWYCIRKGFHDGPCALKPRWWNLRGRWRFGRKLKA